MLHNLKQVLADSGSSLDHVLRAGVYVSDMPTGTGWTGFTRIFSAVTARQIGGAGERPAFRCKAGGGAGGREGRKNPGRPDETKDGAAKAAPSVLNEYDVRYPAIAGILRFHRFFLFLPFPLPIRFSSVFSFTRSSRMSSR